MQHYETIMRLFKAKEETKLIGGIFCLTNGDYGYGYIHITDEIFETNKYDTTFTLEEIASKDFQSKVEELNTEDKVSEGEFEQLDDEVVDIIDYFNPPEFTQVDIRNLQI